MGQCPLLSTSILSDTVHITAFLKTNKQIKPLTFGKVWWLWGYKQSLPAQVWAAVSSPGRAEGWKLEFSYHQCPGDCYAWCLEEQTPEDTSSWGRNFFNVNTSQNKSLTRRDKVMCVAVPAQTANCLQTLTAPGTVWQRSSELRVKDNPYTFWFY